MSTPEMMHNCPADETLAAFIDGRLQGDAHRELLEHLSTCSACRDVVNTAHELAVETRVKTATSTPERRRWAVPLAVAAALAVALFLGPLGEPYRRSRDIASLRTSAAQSPNRLIEGRTSIDTGYQRLYRPRGADDPESAGAELLTAVSKIVRRAKGDPTAANLHAAGLALLLADYDREAVAKLEQARNASASPDADILSDLAAAYHEVRADVRAREAIESAWRLKRSANIAWTRAVVLNTREAWNDYLAIDSTSQWASEARQRAGQIGN